MALLPWPGPLLATHGKKMSKRLGGNGGFRKWVYPNSWMVYKVYNGKSYIKIDDLGEPPFQEMPKWEVRLVTYGLALSKILGKWESNQKKPWLKVETSWTAIFPHENWINRCIILGQSPFQSPNFAAHGTSDNFGSWCLVQVFQRSGLPDSELSQIWRSTMASKKK